MGVVRVYISCMSYTPRLPPRAHQVAGRAKMLAAPGGGDVWAWLMEMGTGKTFSCLWDWAERAEAGETPDLLVIAPGGSYRNWWVDDPATGTVSELTKHLAPDLRARMLVSGWESGQGVGATRALGAFLGSRDRPRAFFVNVEALSTSEKAREAVSAFLAAGRTMMVVDESTRIRTPDAKRTDWIVRAGEKAVSRRIMTGLPTPRSPMDLFSQFEFLDWRILGHRSYWTFRQHFAVMKQVPVGVTVTKTGERKTRYAWTDVAYRNEDELAALVAPYSFRVLKKDCLDLPDKVYLPPRVVELTDEQRRVYADLVNQATAELDGGTFVNAERRVTQVMRLRQVCGGFVTDEEGHIKALKSNRIKALMEVLDEQVGKVIIWCSFTPEVVSVAAHLEEEYGQGAVAEFWGGNANTRHQDEARWKSDPACRFMVATPAAGGVGNNWTQGNLSVYFSNSHDLEHRAQSEDRSHRDGLVGTATYLDLLVPGTVEEKILDCLRRKIDMSSAVMGDGYRQWLR